MNIQSPMKPGWASMIALPRYVVGTAMAYFILATAMWCSENDGMT